MRADPASPLGGSGYEAGTPRSLSVLATQQRAYVHACTTHVVMVTEAIDAALPLGPDDVWEDAETLHYVRNNEARGLLTR